MQVTLKKASEISRALIAAAKAIEVKKTLRISAYGEDEVAPLVEGARAAINDKINRADVLLEAAYALRTLIGAANAAGSVDVLLTEIALIDEKITKRKAIIPDRTAVDIDVYGYEAVANLDIDALTRKVAIMREAVTNQVSLETRRAPVEEVGVTLIDDDMRASLNAEVASLNRRRIEIKDRITAINFTTKIDVPDSIPALLEEENIA